MKRSDIEQWISRDLDGELPPALQVRLEAELARDPGLARLRADWAELARVHHEQPDPSAAVLERVRQDVLRSVRLRAPAKRVALPSWLPRPAWAGAFALAAVLAAGLWVLRPGGDPAAPRLIASAQSTVESVETFAPGSSAMVYEDLDTGVTFVWLLMDEENYNGDV